MGYSLRYFSDFGYFFKMAITQKIEVGISSNLLQSIFISIYIRKCNKKILVILEPFSWAIALGIFQNLAHFLKWL